MYSSSKILFDYKRQNKLKKLGTEFNDIRCVSNKCIDIRVSSN